MKKILALVLALVLAGILLPGAVSSAAAESEPEVNAYDFSLHFDLNPKVYPYRERQHVQGYADLLDLLEIRGTMARCPETQSADVSFELVPRTNPSSAISIRMFGTSSMMRVETPLLGQVPVCFRPTGVMAFARRAWEAFRIPAPYYVLLIPDTTWLAVRCIPDMWNQIVGPVKNGTVLKWKKIQELAEAWRVKLLGGDAPKNWVTAIGYPLEDPAALQTAVEDLSKLIRLAAGGKNLKFEEKEKDGTRTLRLKNAAGDVLWEEHHTENSYDCTLSVPEVAVDYIPSWTYKTETVDGKIHLSLAADWYRGPGTGDEEDTYREEWPDSLLSVRLEAENLPAVYPSDSAFTAEVTLSGYILPNFSYHVTGSTTAAGEITLSLTRKEEGASQDPVFTIRGTVVPKEYTGTLAYVTEEMETTYNIFGLNEQTLHSFVSAVDRPLLKGMIDFLYELPASSCQSIMDDLENYGFIQTLLK